MFIASWLHRIFAAPAERNVAEANPLLRYFAPLELLSWATLRTYKYSAPPELKCLVAARRRRSSVTEPS